MIVLLQQPPHSSFFSQSFHVPHLAASLPEREMCPWPISEYFGDLVSNTST
jgi:hypothetical protein